MVTLGGHKWLVYTASTTWHIYKYCGSAENIYQLPCPTSFQLLSSCPAPYPTCLTILSLYISSLYVSSLYLHILIHQIFILPIFTLFTLPIFTLPIPKCRQHQRGRHSVRRSRTINTMSSAGTNRHVLTAVRRTTLSGPKAQIRSSSLGHLGHLRPRCKCPNGSKRFLVVRPRLLAGRPLRDISNRRRTNCNEMPVAPSSVAPSSAADSSQQMSHPGLFLYRRYSTLPKSKIYRWRHITSGSWFVSITMIMAI